MSPLVGRMDTTMKLTKLLNHIEYLSVYGNTEIEVNDIIYDTRTGVVDGLFVCLKGFVSDSHDLAKDMYNKGTRVFAAEHSLDLPDDATVIIAANTRIALAQLSAAFFDFPAKKLTVIGITGTKGKSSTCYMIRSILEKAGKKVGIIGTIGIQYDNVSVETENSTPASYELHKYFALMVEAGCDTVVMEATSQGFKLHRTYGITFDIGIFTNISYDHIGGHEHPDLEDYVNCKKMLFKQSKFGILNADSDYCEKMIEGSGCPYITYGMGEKANYIGTSPNYIREANYFYTVFYCKHDLEMHKIEVSIAGEFSVYNALAAIACTKKLGTSYEDIGSGLRTTTVKGRMEILPDTDGITVIIDYAHNELSMENLFRTVSLYDHGTLYTVFGCGGSKYRPRRFSMGKIAGLHSDISVLTSDNPRYDDINDIFEDILTGLKPTGGKYIIIPDRKDAIIKTLDRAKTGDIVLLVGKGQEEYEEINGVKHHFSEREIVADYYSSKNEKKL